MPLLILLALLLPGSFIPGIGHAWNRDRCERDCERGEGRCLDDTWYTSDTSDTAPCLTCCRLTFGR
jgi:hypothetical protein